MLNLKKINCSNNKIKNISLQKIDDLLYLDCSNNLITEIKELPLHLKILKCNVNKIQKIDISHTLYKLEELYINYNAIKNLNDICKLQNLICLKCNHNEISEIPSV